MTFSCFSKLPPELRNQIWESSLPQIEPTGFIYKSACWITSGESIISHSGTSQQQQGNLELTVMFCHDLLAEIPLAIPLLSVCQQSRISALSWAHKQNSVRILINGIRKAFDLSKDILYLSPATVDGFSKDPYVVWDRDLPGAQIDTSASRVERIAVHIETLQNIESSSELCLMLNQWFGAVNCILMIVDSEAEPPRFMNQSCSLQEQLRFEAWSGKENDPNKPDGSLSQNILVMATIAATKKLFKENLYLEQSSKLDIQPVKMEKHIVKSC